MFKIVKLVTFFFDGGLMKYILTLTTALFMSNLTFATTETQDSTFTPLQSNNSIQKAISDALGDNYIAQDVKEQANSPGTKNSFQIVEVRNKDSCVVSNVTTQNSTCRENFRVIAQVSYSNYKNDDQGLINLVRMNLKELKSQLLANTNWDGPAYHIFLAR